MGQGMNVSMQDSYNLGWKLGSVMSGTAHHDILSTYNAERRPIALRLIKLDKQMSEFYSQGPSDNSEEYQSFRDGFSRFLSGVSVTYEPNALVTSLAVDQKPRQCCDSSGDVPPQSTDGSAKIIPLGQRLPSHKVVRQCESTVVHLANALPSTGKWRILVFAGDLRPKEQQDIVYRLGAALQSQQRKYSRDGSHATSTVEVLLIHTGSRTSVEPLNMHEVYHSWDGALGWDLWKIFSDDAAEFEPCGSAYEKYGIDKKNGCLVILRPDQHVSFVGPLDQHMPVESFFARFMISLSQ
jgi:phenol 2-monooxygenase